MVCFRLKPTCAKFALFLVIMTAYVMFEKKTNKKNDRIVNIDKEKYEINSLHVYSCYDFICKELFVVRLSKNQYKSTVHSQFLYYVKKTKQLNINIASIFITLTEINNETHYVAKKIKNKKQNTKNPCSDRIRTLSVNLQGSRSSDYTITAMVQ